MSVYETIIRHSLFLFKSKTSADDAYIMLSNTYGKAAPNESSCRDRFQRLRMVNGEFMSNNARPHVAKVATNYLETLK